MKKFWVFGLYSLCFLMSSCVDKSQFDTNSVQNSNINIYSGKTKKYKNKYSDKSYNSLYYFDPKINGQNLGIEQKQFEKENEHRNLRAEKIETFVEGLDYIEEASVAIMESTAIIGISLEDGFNYNDSEIINIKKNIEKNSLLIDKELDRVAITTSPDMFKRITNSNKAENEIIIDDENELLPRVAPII